MEIQCPDHPADSAASGGSGDATSLAYGGLAVVAVSCSEPLLDVDERVGVGERVDAADADVLFGPISSPKEVAAGTEGEVGELSVADGWNVAPLVGE